MKWAEIRVDTTIQAADAVSDAMTENGCGGTSVEGDSPVIVKCYLPVDDRLEERLLSVKEAIARLPEFGLEVGTGEVTVRHAEDQDWAETWKEHFHPIRIGERFVIKPSWEAYEAEPGDRVIELDPGMAFGTGYHPTTQLVLKLMEKRVKPGMTMVDFGTGSGILAIAAARMKASVVVAFDMDEVAVQAARENVVTNDVQEIVEVHRAENPKFVGMQVDLVTANIIADVIMAHAESLANALRVGGTLIASGIIKERQLEVEQSLRNVNFDIVETPTDGEWVAILAKRAR